MENLVIQKGLRNGVICGLWAIIPSIVVMTFSSEGTLESYSNELIYFISLFPVLIMVCCILATSSMTKPNDIFLVCSICALSAIIMMNLMYQLFFALYAGLNDIDADFKFVGAGGVFEPTGILISLFTGFFVGCVRVMNLEKPSDEVNEETNEPFRPPKPTWDPRIQELREELNKTNEAILLMKKELWQNTR